MPRTMTLNGTILRHMRRSMLVLMNRSGKSSSSVMGLVSLGDAMAASSLNVTGNGDGSYRETLSVLSGHYLADRTSSSAAVECGGFPFRPNAKETDMIQTVSSVSSEASQGYHCCCADDPLSHLHILNFISSILKCQANIDLLIFVNSMEH